MNGGRAAMRRSGAIARVGGHKALTASVSTTQVGSRIPRPQRHRQTMIRHRRAAMRRSGAIARVGGHKALTAAVSTTQVGSRIPRPQRHRQTMIRHPRSCQHTWTFPGAPSAISTRTCGKTAAQTWTASSTWNVQLEAVQHRDRPHARDVEQSQHRATPDTEEIQNRCIPGSEHLHNMFRTMSEHFGKHHSEPFQNTL